MIEGVRNGVPAAVPADKQPQGRRNVRRDRERRMKIKDEVTTVVPTRMQV